MIIYKVTNLVNNKIYIGKTIFTLHRRKGMHLADSRSHRGNSIFHSAIRKYGVDNFVWEVLDKVMFSDLLLDLEKFYVAKYNSQTPNGYNLTAGGEGVCGFKFSEESKKKMSNAWKHRKVSDATRAKLHAINLGRHHSDEAKKKCSLTKMGNKNPNFGKHPTDETREKLRLARAKRHFSEETKRKISDSHLGVLNPFYGKTHTEESKAKISATLRARKQSEIVQ